VSKRCVVIMVAVWLAACGAPNPKETPPHPGAPPAAGAGAAAAAAAAQIPLAPAGPGVYAIDPALSEVRLLVYRAGPAAQLGHNHVITNRAMSGWIKFTGDAAAATFALSLPVDQFEVDDPGARTMEGSDFFEEVTDDAKQGTRRNMLSAALLDADRHPTITLVSVSVAPGPGLLKATMKLSIAGHESTLVVPFELATGKGQLSASGMVKLRQTDMGLKPFSVMMGALKVQDELMVKFTLVATVT